MRRDPAPPEGTAERAGTAMVVRQEGGLTFDPANVDEALRFCTHLVKSGFLPRAIRTAEQALMVFLTGRELGLGAMQALRAIHVVEGRPTLSADLMAALVMRSPVCERFVCVESTDQVATYEAQRRGQPPVRRSFTMDAARRAGLAGRDNWRQYPAAMLRARAKADLARDVFPDVLVGVYDPDELEPAPPAQRPEQARRQVEAVEAELVTEEPEDRSAAYRERARRALEAHMQAQAIIAEGRAAEAASPPPTPQADAEARARVLQLLTDAEVEASVSCFDAAVEAAREGGLSLKGDPELTAAYRKARKALEASSWA